MQTDDFDEFLNELDDAQMAVNVGMANRWWKKLPEYIPLGKLTPLDTDDAKAEIYCKYLNRTPVGSSSLAQAWWRLLGDRNKIIVYFGEDELEEED